MRGTTFKQDINLLDKPIWTISEHKDKRILSDREIIFSNDNSNGKFIIRYGLSLAPNHVNIKIFYYLFMRCQQNGSDSISITRHKILSDCGLATNSENYEKIIETARIFTGMQIEAIDCWYHNKQRKTMIFTIMRNFIYNEDTNLIFFQLNDSFLEMLKNSLFIQYINFNEYKKLKKPISARLYELLKTKLTINNIWNIECFKLAEKLTIESKFVSEIIRKVTVGIDEINKRTSFLIAMEIHECKSNKKSKVLVFKKIKQLK